MDIKETITKTFDLYNTNHLDFISGFDYDDEYAKTVNMDYPTNENDDCKNYDPDDLNYYKSQIQEDIYVRDSSIINTMRQISGFGCIY
jgi:hypothetical protein